MTKQKFPQDEPEKKKKKKKIEKKFALRFAIYVPPKMGGWCRVGRELSQNRRQFFRFMSFSARPDKSLLMGPKEQAHDLPE